MSNQDWNALKERFKLDRWNRYSAHFSENFEDSEEARLFLETVNDMQIATVIKFHLGDYYHSWLNEKAPALGYLTPRSCLATEEGRNVLRELLMEFP